MANGDETSELRFSLIVGGPFTGLLGRCRLLGSDRLPTPMAALLLASAAWLIPGACALAQSVLRPPYDGAAYFTDVSTLARYFIAIGTMLATERHADQRLREVLREFWEERIVVGAARARLFEYLRAADRQTSSALVQCLILAAAWIGAGQALHVTIGIERVGWEGATAGAATIQSWAGIASRQFSVPLFEFLILLWLWRLAVWTFLLYRISRLPLQLTPLHADGCAGLGFLGLFPGVFRGFVFALSCVVAALLLKDFQLHEGAAQFDQLRNLSWAWFGVVVVLFVGPLLVFYKPLYALREAELTQNGRRVNRWYKEFHRHWLEEDSDPGSEWEGTSRPALSDLNTALDALRDMRMIPLDRAAFVQLLVAAAAPIAAAAATQMPLRDLMGKIAGFAL